MTSIKAENRELDALDINQPKESPPRARRPAARGYYLALTFCTLLSSQGADAQKLDPSGLRSWLEVQLYAGFQQLPIRGAGPAALSDRAAHGEPYTTSRGSCTDPPSGPRRACESAGQRPRKPSIPTVSPGRRPISRTASRTPGMNEARS